MRKDPPQRRERSDPKVERNATLVLLLRAMFKWEVFKVYEELTNLNYGRYYYLSKPIGRDYIAPRITSARAEVILANSRSFRREFIEVEEMEHTTDKLDKFARCISLLGRYKDWADFAGQIAFVPGVTDAFLELQTNKHYINFSDETKQRINKLVRSNLEQKVYEFDYHYMLGEKGFQVGYHKHVKMASEIDYLALCEFGSLMGNETIAKHVADTLLYKHTWVLIDQERKIHGTVSMIPLSADDYQSLRRTRNTFKVRKSYTDVDSTPWICHVTNLLYDSNQAQQNLKFSLNLSLNMSYGIYNSIDLYLCAFITRKNDFLVELGFQPDQGESPNSGLYMVHFPQFDLKLENQKKLHYAKS